MPNAFAVSLFLLTAALVGGVYIGGTMLTPLQTVAYFGGLVLGVALVLRFFEWAAAGGKVPPIIDVTPVPAGPGVPQIPSPPTPALPPPPPLPPPPSDFERCLAVTLKNEGGNDDDPNDPGGRTSRGITAGDWAAWRQTHPGLPSDVWQAPQDQIAAIYKERYWDVVQGDQLPAGVDMMVFDIGVLTGVGEAAMLLEGIVGTDVDGEIGPLTIAAAKTANPTDIINKLSANWLRYLQTRGNAATYIRGWTTRVNYTTQQALGMVGTAAPTTSTVSTSTSTVVPVQLAVMRDLVARGVHATHDNPEIMTWPPFIAMKFSNVVGLGTYCAGYVHDSIAWCGLTMAFCLAKAGIMPAFTNGDDLKSFLWAFGWMDSGWGTTIWRWDQGIPISQATPQMGDIMVFDWSYQGDGQRPSGGQGHVTMYDHLSPSDDLFWCSGGNQGNHLCSTEGLLMKNCVAILRPLAPSA